MGNKKIYLYLTSICWVIFYIGILEVMIYLLGETDILNFFLLALLLFFTVIITSLQTFRPRVGYYHELTPYLIHPIFLFLGLIGFLIFNDHPYLQQIAVVLSLFGYLILFSENFSDLTHKAHDGVKFLIIFLLYDSVFESVHFYNLSPYLIPLFITLITLFLFLHMFWRLKAFGDKFLALGLLFSLLIGGMSLALTSFYYLSSFLILSIILLTIYYLLWGILHHYIQKNLTLSLFLEYLLIVGIIISMFLGLITGW